MAYVHDAKHGVVTVVSGTTEKTYSDPALAQRLQGREPQGALSVLAGRESHNRRLEDPQGRLLDFKHAPEQHPEPPDDRDGRLFDPRRVSWLGVQRPSEPLAYGAV